MLRSMSAAISGMRNHQVAMDVVANNIANVNTVGFKSGRADFKEAVYQSYSKGMAPSTSTGGTNPVQVGLGLTLGGISANMGQGSLITTGKNTDVMIQGEGFFMLGKLDSGGNTVVDGYTRDGAFATDSDGYLVDPVTGDYVLGLTSADKTTLLRIMIPSDWKSFSIGADGMITGVNGSGTLEGLTDDAGTTASPPDGATHVKIGLAKFANPAGLVKAGGSLYEAGANAGTPTTAPPLDATDATGSLVSGSLEASNVDLAEQFSRMIMAQRGFQANSRIITTSDEMLQELVNLKR